MFLVVEKHYNGVIYESSLCFRAAKSLNPAGLSKMIVCCLERRGLDYRNNLVGQGYDAASVMSGKHCGVSARIQSNTGFAFYVHCNAQCLNLDLVDASKAMPQVVGFFAFLQQLYNCVWLLCAYEVACSTERAASIAAAQGTIGTFRYKVDIPVHSMNKAVI